MRTYSAYEYPNDVGLAIISIDILEAYTVPQTEGENGLIGEGQVRI
jgi:hypothetical protein